MDSFIDLPTVDKAFDRLYGAIEFTCKMILLAMVLVITYTVFGRFVLNRTPTWGEELSIFLMVWLAVLGSSLAVRNGIHIRMTIIEFILPKGITVWLHRLAYVLIFAVGLVMLFAGMELYELFSGSILGALRISRKWIALALPVGGVANMLMCLARLRRGDW